MASAIVPEILRKDNYDAWSVCMKNYLLAQDLWDIIGGPNTEPPNQPVAEAEFKVWMKKNATALHAIQISCSPDIFSRFGNADSAKMAWDTLSKNSIRNPCPFGSKGKYDSEYIRVPPLIHYFNRHDWNSIIRYLEENRNLINSKISSAGFTTLHLAASVGGVEIVRKLVDLMSREGLAIQDVFGNAALHYAAGKGTTEMVECMIEKNDTLIAIANCKGFIPIVSACARGRRDTTVYLLRKTPFELLSQENTGYGSLLLHFAIVSKMFGKSYTP